jgi:hypothetical protein
VARAASTDGDLYAACDEPADREVAEEACAEPTEDDEDGCPDGTSCRSTGGGSDNRKVCFPSDLGTSTTG